VVTDSAIRRLLIVAGDDIDALMTLCRADITSKNETKVKRYLKNYEIVVKKLKEVEENDSVRNFQPPVTGKMIMKTFGISPSRPIGEIKKAIKEAILEGDIKNDPDEAFELMLKIGSEMGLKRI
jgi:poly(A) polymerase